MLETAFSPAAAAVSIFRVMKIKHFYRCFGCGAEHDDRSGAVLCCAVVQEIFSCDRCGEEFPSREKAENHWNKIFREIADQLHTIEAARVFRPLVFADSEPNIGVATP